MAVVCGQGRHDIEQIHGDSYAESPEGQSPGCVFAPINDRPAAAAYEHMKTAATHVADMKVKLISGFARISRQWAESVSCHGTWQKAPCQASNGWPLLTYYHLRLHFDDILSAVSHFIFKQSSFH